MTFVRGALQSALVCVIASHAARAQSGDSIRVGDRLRLSLTSVAGTNLVLQDTKAVGNFIRWAGDTVFLQLPSQPLDPTFYRLQSIASVERSVGRYHPMTKSMVFGTLIGAGLGWSYGRASAGLCVKHVGNTCSTPVQRANQWAVAGAAGGLGIGALVGASLTLDKWTVVDVSMLRMRF